MKSDPADQLIRHGLDGKRILSRGAHVTVRLYVQMQYGMVEVLNRTLRRFYDALLLPDDNMFLI